MSEAKHPLAAAIEPYLKAYLEGDETAAAEYYSEDIEFFVQGEHAWAGEYRGKADVTRLLRRLMHETCDKYELLDVEDILYSDTQVATMPHWRLTLNGKVLELKVITVYTFRDEKISRVRMYFEDPHRASKFYSLGR